MTQILNIREQAIDMRHSMHVKIINKMLSDNFVSPRSY